MILLIGGEKGGSGKSTIACTLAAMSAARGRATLLVDADPQGTASAWAAARPETAARVVCVPKGGQDFLRDVRDLASRYDTTVIDAGGRDSRELRAGLVLADRLYTPLQPAYADAWTLGRMEELTRQARDVGSAIEAFLVINRASTHPAATEAEELAAYVESEMELVRYAGVILKDRAAWRRALGFGLSVEEMEPADEKAAAEALALYQHAFEAE